MLLQAVNFTGYRLIRRTLHYESFCNTKSHNGSLWLSLMAIMALGNTDDIYELQLYSNNRYLTYKSTYFPQGRWEGTAIYAICATVKGMVFKPFTLG